MKIKEYLSLFWLNLVVKKREFLEYLKVIFRYYPNTSFAKRDLILLGKYFFKSPYSYSKEFLISQGEEEIYAYGETPLTTLETIAKLSHLSKEDTVFELGSGRGRSCFWLSSFIGCKVIGIDFVPAFIKKALEVKEKFHLSKLDFRQEDLLQSNFSEATVIYLYGTCYDTPFLKRLVKKFAILPKGTKIITVSYPLTDYAKKGEYQVIQKTSLPFTWGMGEVYFHIKS
jgi:hypothetical protein